MSLEEYETLITPYTPRVTVEQERGFPVTSVLASLVLAMLVLIFSLSGVEPSFAYKVLSSATAAAALAAALVSAGVLVARGFLLDPFAGLALLYAVPGFLLAAVGWALDAAAISVQLGPLALSRWMRYSSSFLIMLALWELGVMARRLAGLKPVEAAIAIGLPLAYASLLSLAASRWGAPMEKVAETLASSVFLVLSLLAFLPIRRRRYSWGLTLMTAGLATFVTAVPLAGLFALETVAPLSLALYTLSFIFAASGIYVYGGESVLLR